ncbi:pentapeptide repeat-containing protein [Sodalis sp.]|uniref:pentapeptide repeat-containing protein n=1 Tax=Sodalis sp. (in: enterobacteria) TaxID=1898979 RepID=UPI003872AEA6
MNHADLTRVNLYCVNLVQVNLTGTDFIDADLTFIKLIGSYLTDADFTGVNLNFADLSYADLNYIDLSKAKLPGKCRQLMAIYMANAAVKDLRIVRCDLFDHYKCGVSQILRHESPIYRLGRYFGNK